MTISARQAHWGEAAYYLSLDLAAPILALMINPAHLGPDQREIVRRAVLANRESFERNARPINIGNAILGGLGGNGQMEAIRAFVDNELVTHARPRPPSFDPLLDIYMVERINERLSDHLRRSGNNENVRVALDGATDGEAYETFLEALAAADVAIAGGSLSTWDRDIVRRNANSLHAVDPLANLVSTFDFRQKRFALERYAADVGAKAVDERRAQAQQFAGS